MGCYIYRGYVQGKEFKIIQLHMGGAVLSSNLKKIRPAWDDENGIQQNIEDLTMCIKTCSWGPDDNAQQG